MVDAPVTNLLTAQDYEDRGVRAMHAVLIELGQILGPYRGAVVVVGGAVPYLLLRGADPPHVGTLDVDLDLDPERLAEGAYAEFVETLERAGYRRSGDGLKPFQLQRAVDLGDGGDAVTVLVDLLMPRDAKTRRNRPSLIAGLRVQGADAGEIALKNNVRLSVDGQMPDGKGRCLPGRRGLSVRFLGALLDCYANEEWRIASWRRAFGAGRKGEGQRRGREGRRRKEKAWRREVGGTCHPFSKFFFNQTARDRAAVLHWPGRDSLFSADRINNIGLIE